MSVIKSVFLLFQVKSSHLNSPSHRSPLAAECLSSAGSGGRMFWLKWLPLQPIHDGAAEGGTEQISLRRSMK